MSNSLEDFNHYTKYGLNFLIPRSLRVEVDQPNIFVASVSGIKGITTFSIHSNLTPQQGRLCEKQMLETPLLQSVISEYRLVRQGKIDTPYSGWEHIVEEKDTHQRINFNWLILFYPCIDRCILLDIKSFGQFADAEQFWTKIIQSFQVNISELVPLKPGVLQIVTENNMFMVGPKDASFPIIDLEKKEDEQGFTATHDRVVVYIPGESIECEIDVKQGITPPALKGVIQAFCVPITIEKDEAIYVHMDFGGHTEKPLNIKFGKYDLVVALSRKRGKYITEGQWLARLSFIPENTIGPKVLKQRGKTLTPKNVYIRKDAQRRAEGHALAAVEKPREPGPAQE